jgi:hypothetical protein
MSSAEGHETQNEVLIRRFSSQRKQRSQHESQTYYGQLINSHQLAKANNSHATQVSLDKEMK